MVKWKEIRIKEIGKVITGSTPPTASKKYFDGEYPFIKPSDLEKEKMRPGVTEMTLSEKGREYFPQNLLPPNTTCIVTIGTIGKHCLTDRPSFTNQQINAVIPDTDKFDSYFVYYLLKAHIPSVKVLNGGSASGRENVKKSSFENIKVKFPPLPIQQKIASILSAYDELIANNNERIRLLEEMAEEIYKEWFVRFRFPGYADSRFLDKEGNVVERGAEGALPEGWEEMRLGEVCSFNERTISKNSAPELIKYIDISSVTTNKINYFEEYQFWEAPSRARRIVVDKDIIWSSVRPANRAYARITNPSYNLVVSTGFIVITPTLLPSEYIYQFSTSNKFVNHMASVAKGSAYPAASVDDFRMMKIVAPSFTLQKKYSIFAQSMVQNIEILQQKNQLLQETRDLLLPRLMSGKLSVEEAAVLQADLE